MPVSSWPTGGFLMQRRLDLFIPTKNPRNVVRMVKQSEVAGSDYQTEDIIRLANQTNMLGMIARRNFNEQAHLFKRDELLVQFAQCADTHSITPALRRFTLSARASSARSFR
jgi:hypothetical protein